MRISGFTLIRNGEKFDFPYFESIRSLLPLVDEMVINVGVGDDDNRRIRGEVRRVASSPWPRHAQERRVHRASVQSHEVEG